ncbi:hypothetical protein BDM02DRAFT_2992320 [Thelephora ganbajun]|uniref:Uncharacterized protein n=1 Tax=Thelephora ganbajun TaxID=370292 RepID=A0ACB6ZB65_THEGA|nr:hypothetical protein BDM02DRAFT_2992320 [Thelephora ganbajun]
MYPIDNQWSSLTSPLGSDSPTLNLRIWSREESSFLSQSLKIGKGLPYSQDTTDLAPKDVTIFLAVLFVHFRRYQRNAFRMTGGLDGGGYIPLFATGILDQNLRLVDPGLGPVAIGSISILRPPHCVWARRRLHLIFHHIFPKRKLPRCRSEVTKFCQLDQNSPACVNAVSFCTDELVVIQPLNQVPQTG